MSWLTKLFEAAQYAIKPKTMYENLYNTAEILATKRDEVNLICKRITAGKAKYEAVAAVLANGVPWWFIGITHFMEAGHFYPNQFLYHLHCGDPLTGRTFHVPKGRPKANPANGLPPSKDNPYTWQESALDALRFMGYDKVKDWSIDKCLQLFEKYNGMGYKSRGVPSPYLWSYTQHYIAGKFTFDGKYDPKAVSKQPGVVALMKGLGI